MRNTNDFYGWNDDRFESKYPGLPLSEMPTEQELAEAAQIRKEMFPYGARFVALAMSRPASKDAKIQDCLMKLKAASPATKKHYRWK